MDHVCHYHSPLGDLTLASDGEALIGLWFDDQKYYADTLQEGYDETASPLFDDAIRWLDAYFNGQIPSFVPEFHFRTSAFRQRVWQILLTIPYGKTMTYQEIAQIIAKERGIEKMSAQAVGNAVGHNPISLIIPCHRVIGSDGSLTGYAGGLERKRELLEMEKRVYLKVHPGDDKTNKEE